MNFAINTLLNVRAYPAVAGHCAMNPHSASHLER